MNLINTRGIYYIEAIPGKIIHSSQDAVRLRIRATQDKKEQKIFTLVDLRELQSKLVLVAAENADNVNRFIEVSYITVFLYHFMSYIKTDALKD